MSPHLNIRITTLTDGIRDIQFKCISDYIDAMSILKLHNCTHTGFQANEGEYYHIFTNEAGLVTLRVYYQ